MSRLTNGPSIGPIKVMRPYEIIDTLEVVIVVVTVSWQIVNEHGKRMVICQINLSSQ